MAGEVQDLIDAQIGADGVGGRVLLPRKVFQVRETIRIAGVRGLKITGQAPAATDLRWFGPSDVPMFDIDRCQDIVVEDLSITVGADAMLIAAAWIQQGDGPLGPKGNPKLESSHVAWQNIVVRGQGNLERRRQERPSLVLPGTGERVLACGVHVGGKKREGPQL
jgi:hypothetical protein